MRRAATTRVRALTAATLLLAMPSGCAERAPAPQPVTGQWIWSARDSALLQAMRTRTPGLRAGVWVATIVARGDSLVTALGRPLDASVGSDAEIVIRVDDSFSAWWGRVPLDTIAARLDVRITRIVQVAERGGAPHAIQLDYDAPVARLPEYASLVGRLRRAGGAPQGRTLWITSLAAHLAEPRYGPLFRPMVDGHILQLFDTGDRYSDARARDVRERIERAAMPFRLGVGAFERRLANGATTHRAWFDFIPGASRVRGYRGTWIFPGGQAYASYLPS